MIFESSSSTYLTIGILLIVTYILIYLAARKANRNADGDTDSYGYLGVDLESESDIEIRHQVLEDTDIDSHGSNNNNKITQLNEFNNLPYRRVSSNCYNNYSNNIKTHPIFEENIDVLRYTPLIIYEEILSRVKVQVYNPGDIIFSCGNKIQRYYVVEKGEVGVTPDTHPIAMENNNNNNNNNNIIVDQMNLNSFTTGSYVVTRGVLVGFIFSLFSCIERTSVCHHTTAIATTEVTCSYIECEDLKELILNDATITRQIVFLLANTLQRVVVPTLYNLFGTGFLSFCPSSMKFTSDIVSQIAMKKLLVPEDIIQRGDMEEIALCALYGKNNGNNNNNSDSVKVTYEKLEIATGDTLLQGHHFYILLKGVISKSSCNKSLYKAEIGEMIGAMSHITRRSPKHWKYVADCESIVLRVSYSISTSDENNTLIINSKSKSKINDRNVECIDSFNNNNNNIPIESTILLSLIGSFLFRFRGIYQSIDSCVSSFRVHAGKQIPSSINSDLSVVVSGRLILRPNKLSNNQQQYSKKDLIRNNNNNINNNNNNNNNNINNNNKLDTTSHKLNNINKSISSSKIFKSGDLIGERNYLLQCLKKFPEISHQFNDINEDTNLDNLEITGDKIIALRDSELCLISSIVLDILSVRFPATILHFACKIISDKVKCEEVGSTCTSSKGVNQQYNKYISPSIISVVSLCPTISMDIVGERMKKAFEINKIDVGILKIKNNNNNNHPCSYHHVDSSVNQTIDYLERDSDVLLLVADYPFRGKTRIAPLFSWLETCINNSDLILLVTRAGASPDITPVEKLLLEKTCYRFSAPVHLLLLHEFVNDGCTGSIPSGDRFQPGLRNYVKHFLYRGFTGFTVESNNTNLEIKSDNEIVLKDDCINIELLGRNDNNKIKELNNNNNNNNNNNKTLRYGIRHFVRPRPYVRRTFHIRNLNFESFARLTLGRGIALLLGGGGARGCAHFGIVKALKDMHIPIDVIAGVSMGSAVGALYALHGTDNTSDIAGKFLTKAFSRTRLLFDLTIPVVSYFTGALLNRALKDSFSRVRIEDLWTPFVCTSSDIINTREHIHSNGYIWKAVRASMSLVGFVPPFPFNVSGRRVGMDSEECALLVDGGYINNFPVEQVLSMGAGLVIAVDVAAATPELAYDYGETLSGITYYLHHLGKILGLHRIHPKIFHKHSLPSLAEVSSRLMYLSDTTNRQYLSHVVDLMLTPPVQQFGLLEFDNYREISDVGYRYALNEIDMWLQIGDNNKAKDMIRELKKVEECKDR